MTEISRAERNEWQQALTLLFQSMPPDMRAGHVEELLEAERQGHISLNGLFIARSDSQIEGAVMSVVQEDGTVFVWAAQAGGRVNCRQTVDALYRNLVSRMREAGIRFAQSIVETNAEEDREVLRRNEFRHLVDLFYLQRPLAAPLPPADVEFEITTFSDGENDGRFARLIEETYVETLDCPDFHEHRTGREALASHRYSGEFSRERWKLYAVEGRDVGLLLMNDHPQQDAWEVVYMGVAPQARGRGYGRAMLIDGLRAAREAGRQSVLLAVDSQNDPANRIYGELGFMEVARRAVHAWSAGRGEGES